MKKIRINIYNSEKEFVGTIQRKNSKYFQFTKINEKFRNNLAERYYSDLHKKEIIVYSDQYPQDCIAFNVNTFNIFGRMSIYDKDEIPIENFKDLFIKGVLYLK